MQKHFAKFLPICSQITKPKQSAYIRLVNTSPKKTIFKIDATDKSVNFNGNSLTFRPNITDEDQIYIYTRETNLKLRLDEGVAMSKEGGECGSEAKAWKITVPGNAEIYVQFLLK